MVLRRAVTRECPKKVASLIDLVNLPTPLRNFSGQSQMSHLSFFISVWSYIKQNNLQDVNNKNLVKCDEKLKSILLGKPQVELAELPGLIKLHFPKVSQQGGIFSRMLFYLNKINFDPLIVRTNFN